MLQLQFFAAAAAAVPAAAAAAGIDSYIIMSPSLCRRLLSGNDKLAASGRICTTKILRFSGICKMMLIVATILLDDFIRPK